MTQEGITLKGKDRRYLRGLGVALRPVVVVGKEGLTDAVLASVESEIEARELIKVRLLETVETPRKEFARELAERAGVELIQVLGRTVLLYRRHAEKPTIQLPT